MNNEKFSEKCKRFFKKIGNRNLIIVCAVLLIGTAVGVNYILNRPKTSSPTIDPGIDLSDTDLKIDDETKTATYFAQSVLSRKQARDESLEVLQSVVDNGTAVPEAVETALQSIAKIAGDIETEANIETLVKAKGFEDCIAVISDDTATVIVTGEELSVAELAQIKEIVYEQANIPPTKLTIINK